MYINVFFKVEKKQGAKKKKEGMRLTNTHKTEKLLYRYNA